LCRTWANGLSKVVSRHRYLLVPVMMTFVKNLKFKLLRFTKNYASRSGATSFSLFVHLFLWTLCLYEVSHVLQRDLTALRHGHVN